MKWKNRIEKIGDFFESKLFIWGSIIFSCGALGWFIYTVLISPFMPWNQ